MVLSSSPDWFLGFDSLLEFLTTWIAFFIGYYSYKFFRISKNSKYFYLGFSFFAIALAYLAKAFTNILIYLEANRAEVWAIKVQNIAIIHDIGIIAYVALILIAYITLVALALKIKDMRILSLLVVTAVLATIIGSSSLLFFHVLSFIFLLYIIPYFYTHYKQTRDAHYQIVVISFLLIAFSHLCFILLLTGHQLFYVYGEITQLFGYLGLLMNLIWCLRYG